MVTFNDHVLQSDVPSPNTVAGVGIAAAQVISVQHSPFASFMEPVKLLASGLTLEESKVKRQEKQAARYRHRLGCVSTSWAFGHFLIQIPAILQFTPTLLPCI